MSGGIDNLNTTLQAVSITDYINKELKIKNKKFENLPVLISGGTNTYTGDLARQCGVNFNGITIGMNLYLRRTFLLVVRLKFGGNV